MNWTFRPQGEIDARVPDLSLGDKALPRSLATAPVGAALSTQAGPLTFVLDAGVEATLESFNDTSDVDALGVVGLAPAKPDLTTLAPPLVMDERTAWLKFGARARVKTEGTV